MKKYLILALMLILPNVICVMTAKAQFTISIPKIPKITKTKPPVTVTNDAQVTTQDNNTTTTNSTATAKSPDGPCTDIKWWVDYHIDQINKDKKSAEEYTPDTRLNLVYQNHNENYVLMALSKAELDKFLIDHKAQGARNCPGDSIEEALASLATVINAKMPSYLPKATNFANRNAGEEALMKGKAGDLTKLQIHKIGIVEPSWLIDKNDYGLPTARYKHGKMWVKRTTDDYSYCHLYSINIIQDYAGGGTYGASYARYIDDEVVGCPAGK